MGYTLTQINTILSKADRAIHILGSVAYNKKFAELDETYWYDRDIIFLYKYAAEWGKVNDRVGTARMDSVVERLETMMEIYDYGSLTPIYSQVAQVTGINTVNFLTEETDPTVPAWVKLITESDIDNWDDSYGNKITSAAVTGTNTKTLTLNQQDGGTVTASWTDINTDAVSSVFGRTGAVIAQSGDYTTTQVTEGLNLYYTDGRVRNAISESIVGIDYNSTTGVFSTTAGYSIPTTSSQANWDTAYANRITSLTTTGASGAATLISNILNIPAYTLAGLGGISLTSLSASSPLLYNNTTGVFSIQVANGSQNGYLSSTDWTTFNSKQATITLTTTGSSGSATLVGATLNVPTYSLSGLGGVPTSRQLTINGTAYDLSADRSWSVGTVTSVAASITGNSLSISNSPIINSGTLAFSFLGNATQYVRGDGQLATLPTNGGGGGASVSYYLNGSINQGTIGGATYYEMNKTPIIGAGTDFSRSSNGYIASFLTDANDPALLNIPAGNFNFETYFEASSGGGTPTFYIELYKYDGTTFTLIASNSTNPKIINSGTSVEAYFTALAVPQTTLTLTDRLAIRIYVTTAGRTITLHTENSNLCQVITTFTTGLTALNGLTSQVQYFATGTSGTDFNISSATATHTFNLPTASATNRGALSSADWTTFNNKQNALTNPITGTGTTNTLPKFTGASTIGNSNITDTGSLITLGTNARINGSIGFSVDPLNWVTIRANKNITGNLTSTGISQGGTVQSDVTTARGIINGLVTQAASFTLPEYWHFQATQGTIGAGSTVTNQIGYYVDNTLTGATNNFGFRGQIPSGTNRWNIYMDGTANNYIAGNLGIGSASIDTTMLRISRAFTSTLATSIFLDSQASSTNTSATYIATSANTQAATFTTQIRHISLTQGTFGAGSTVTDQYGVLVGDLTGATRNYGFFGNISAAANRWNLYMNGTANNYMAGSLGIGSTSLTGYNLRISLNPSAAASYGIMQDGTALSSVTASYHINRTLAQTQAAVFTLPELAHYYATQGTFGAGSTVTNQYGFIVGNLTGATSNYGFFGQVSSGTNRWNLYMNGTADNYLAGNLGIGTTTIAARLTVVGATTVIGQTNVSARFSDNVESTLLISHPASTGNTATITGNNQLAFSTGTVGNIAERMRINSTGSVGVGVSSINASARLQVDSTTQGVLISRMTSAQRTAISSPATGLLVYQTDGVEGFYVYSGGSWKSLTMV